MSHINSLIDKLLQSQNDTHTIKQLLCECQDYLKNQFHPSEPIQHLLTFRSYAIDVVLKNLWNSFFSEESNHCLIAVGGYGRQQLFPYSDIDIVILYNEKSSSNNISNFLTALWDLGLKVGHSTRSIQECLTKAKDDISIYTSLLEMRYISGSKPLFESFNSDFFQLTKTNNQKFLNEKITELEKRHSKYNETAYLLEPDLKNSPGSLRDIHQIRWLCLQYFHTAKLSCLLDNKVLTGIDLQLLTDCESFLSKTRFVLHLINLKDDNRLFFDKQLLLGKQFNAVELESHKIIEAFMKQYFIIAKEVRAIYDIVTQYFKELILLKNTPTAPFNDFCDRKQTLLILKKNINIADHPELLLKLFLLLSTDSNQYSLSAYTLLEIRKHRYLINDTFRSNPEYKNLFLSIFKQPQGIFTILQSMNRHKVLGKYLLEFEHVIGQTQHDLFHLYTVDQHTLFVIKKIEFLKENNEFYSGIFTLLPKPELLFIAALFHDIGKGRNTDHSKYGAEAIKEFAQQHKLPKAEAAIIRWLVKAHLLMSHTAQKKDLNDLNEIKIFARQVKNIERLRYLYLLTVADIQATNETIWNSWKDSLLKQLFLATSKYFSSKSEKHAENYRNDYKKTQVLDKLDTPSEKVNSLWDKLGSSYFEKKNISQILWNTKALLQYDFNNEKALVRCQTTKDHGATEILVCCKNKDNLFAQTVVLIDKLQLNIVEANIFTSKEDYAIDTYSVLTRDNKVITNAEELKNIESFLQKQLSKAVYSLKISKRRIPRQLAHFCQHTKVYFSNTDTDLTQLTVKTVDRPGLLAKIGQVFFKQSIRLHNAKIVTLGDQVEDVFYISDKDNKPITCRKQQYLLRKKIVDALS